MLDNINFSSTSKQEHRKNESRASAKSAYFHAGRAKGVVCDVIHCGFNDGSGGCTAERIAVGPSSASECADTVCATFKPREGSVCS